MEDYPCDTLENKIIEKEESSIKIYRKNNLYVHLYYDYEIIFLNKVTLMVRVDSII